MDIVNIHEAKTHLSRLIEKATKGESVIIAKAGKPVAKLGPIDASSIPGHKRFGLLPDLEIPDDFDTMGQAEIERMFYGDP